jgi:uncharacterized surface protein with fasciclin (FAS1) repeats
MADLVETAIAAKNFNTLIKAVKAVDLIETLKSPGSLTLFAPTDEAFANLPEGTLDSLLQDIPKLKKIVAYHVGMSGLMTWHKLMKPRHSKGQLSLLNLSTAKLR